MNSIKWISFFAAVGAIALFSGCQSTPEIQPYEPVVFEVAPEPEPEPVAEPDVGIFDYDGIPVREYLVGGGYNISYRATEEGDLYVADENSNKLLATISLAPGSKYDFNLDLVDEKLASNLKMLGIDPEKAVIRVYFVPRR